MAYSISDEIVVNWTTADKDECIHFLTHIDATNGPAPDASYYVSPSARTIFTSHYNEWFLRTYYALDNVRSWNLNTKVTLEFRKRKYIFTFLDAKHCLGSISILLYGNCGAHLYTGNFSYCSNFLRSPLLAPLLERKVPLKCLYIDATHYEQESNFLGIDENIELATALMRYTNARILLFIDSYHLYPILAELAVRLQEKLYIRSGESNKFLQLSGYSKYFTKKEQGSRITIFDEHVKKNRSKGLVVYFHRVIHKENSEFHKYKVDPRTSAHHFYFYANSNHQDCCRLLNKLIPEELIHLNRAVIDRSKMLFHQFNINKTAATPATFKKSFSNDKKTVVVSKHYLQSSSKGDTIYNQDNFEGSNLCGLTKSDSTSEQSKQVLLGLGKSYKGIQNNEKTLSYKNILINQFDTSHIHKYINSDEEISGKLSMENANKQNSNSPNLTPNNTHNVPKNLKAGHLLMEQNSNALRHTEQFEERDHDLIRVEESNEESEIIISSDEETESETESQSEPAAFQGRIRVRKFDDSFFYKPMSSDNSSGTNTAAIEDKINTISPNLTNSSTNNISPKLKVLTPKKTILSQLQETFKESHIYGSVTSKSNDQPKIINSSDNTETKVQDKSVIGLIRVKKFDECYFNKAVSSNNSSVIMSTTIADPENTISPSLTNISTNNIAPKLKVKKLSTHQEKHASQVGERFKVNNASASVAYISQDHPEIISCFDDTETNVQHEPASCEGLVRLRKLDDSHFHKAVSPNSSGKVSTGLKCQENTAPVLPGNHIKPIQINKILTQKEKITSINQDKFQGNKTYGSIIIQSNKPEMQSKPIILKRVITLTKLGKLPLHKHQNSKIVCEPQATNRLVKETLSLTNNGANNSKELTVKNALVRQENSSLLNQETADGTNDSILIGTEENKQSEGEVHDCSETNNAEIQDRPSFHKGIVHRNKLDLLINCKHVFSEIKGSKQDKKDDVLSSSTANTSYNTRLEGGTNFLIVPKQLLHSSPNLTQTVNPTIDNMNKKIDGCKSSDNICTIDKIKQNYSPSVISSSPCKNRKEVKNSLKVVVQNESVTDDSMKKLAQTNDNKNISEIEHLAKEDNKKAESLSLDNINRNKRDSSVNDEGDSKIKRFKIDNVNFKKVAEIVPRETRSKRPSNDESMDMKNYERKIRESIEPCSVVIDANSITKRYFYSPSCEGYLPSFFGFHRTALRPRKLVNSLRILKQKCKKSD